MGSRAHLVDGRLDTSGSPSHSIKDTVSSAVAAIYQAVRARNEYAILVGQGADPAAAAAEALRRTNV